MINYKGFEIEYDELFGWIVYDENMIPISAKFDTLAEAKATIDRF